MKDVFLGDCLDILKQQPAHLVDVVYLDPPFFTQKTHTLQTRDGSRTYSFADEWDSLTDYLDFLRARLIEIRRVMKPTATLFFHCDRTASHHICLMLDEVFGAERFLSEIIWTYRRWSNNRQNLLNSHQTIFMYSKTVKYQFNKLYEPYSETTNLDQILQKRERLNGKAVYARDEEGTVILNGAKKGVPLSDVWEIPYLNPKAKERMGYPTQKPILLLEQIIQLVTHPNDVVLDPFCGSGTALVAAALLNRHYLGINAKPEAVELTKARLNNPIKSDSFLLKNGRASYNNSPEQVKNLLAGLPVKLVQRNAGIDAIHNDYIEGRPVLIRVQREGEDLSQAAEKLAKAGQKKQAYALILIQTCAADIKPMSSIKIIPSTALSLQKIMDCVGCESG